MDGIKTDIAGIGQYSEAQKREKALKAVEKLYAENGDALKELAKIEMEEYTDEQIAQWIDDD